VDAWADKLADPADKTNSAFFALDTLLRKYDSTTVINFINKLGRHSESKSDYFIARYNCLKASRLLLLNPITLSYLYESEHLKNQVTRLLAKAMDLAYESGDNYLAAFVSSTYGGFMANFGNKEAAVMYLMNGAELYDKVHMHGAYFAYSQLGEMLWQVREYEKSIQYTKEAIIVLNTSVPPEKERYMVMCNNTIALSFHRMGQYDSAFFYYKTGLDLISRMKDKEWGNIWTGIISGNMAQIDYIKGDYTTALPLFELDYNTSMANNVDNNAANSLQWAARTNLALGNKTLALKQVRESLAILLRWPKPADFRENAYLTASEIFKAMEENDSAYYYANKYNLLHDSLERVIYLSSINISQLRLSNQMNRYNIQNLQQEKNAQLRQRNFIIAGILLLCIITLLLINRQRQKFKFKSEMAHREKLRIEEEMESAKAQLKLFTKSIIEKTNLIEKLEKQVQNNIMTQQEEELIEELSHQTILTEEDWLNFKTLFGKIYPQFFEKLIKQVNNITQAEQRMAALTMLHLTTKQMAVVLGISPNSVIKAKQRLRQRFNLETDQQVEEFVDSL
jgi:DNA-binding CsgD family transcriptional regulator